MRQPNLATNAPSSFKFVMNPGYCLLILVALIGNGCCSVVARSGDAKILTCWPSMPPRGHTTYRMVLPAVSLAQVDSHVIKVRDLPAHFVGLFSYSLSIPLTHEDVSSKTDVPWKAAKITVILRRLDGSEAYKETILLGTARFLGMRAGEVVTWTLAGGRRVPIPDRSYDIIVVIEQPSRRQTDKISLQGRTYLRTSLTSAPSSRIEADRLMAMIRPGMTLSEIVGAVPHSAISPPFDGEHDGVWYSLTINEQYVIWIRVARPRPGASAEQSVINYSPRLGDRKTSMLIWGEEKAW